MKGRSAVATGSILAAMASSACCWLPLALMGVGLSAAGAGAFFERYRPYFLIVAVFLLGVGFYFNYFRKERCAPGEACEVPNPKFRRFNIGMLWVSVLFVAAFALFPSYVGMLWGSQEISAGTAAAADTDWTLKIQGMTCTGCEATLVTALSDVPGVKHAVANFEDARATISIDADDPPDSSAIAAAIRRVGYEFVVDEPSLE